MLAPVFGMSFFVTGSNAAFSLTRAIKDSRFVLVLPLNMLRSSLMGVPSGGMLAMISAADGSFTRLSRILLAIFDCRVLKTHKVWR